LWCRRQGHKAQKKPPEKQKEVAENTQNKLEVTQNKDTNKWNIRGSFLVKLREEFRKKKDAICEGLSSAAHKIIFLKGMFFLSFCLLLLAGEFFLLKWTLSPYGLTFENLLIAGAISIIGMITTDKFLSQIKKIKPESYQKYLLYILIFSLILIIFSGVLLAHTRGALLQAQTSGQELGEQIDTAERFYQKTSYLPFVMAAMTIALSMIMGIVLHQALTKVITSGNVLILERKIKRTEEKILHAKMMLEELEFLVRNGMAEFYIGLNDDLPRKRSFRLSPVFAVLLALLLLLFLVVAIARGYERQSVNILIDLSTSSLSVDYAGRSDFQKNISALHDIVKRIEPGTRLKITAITEKSFEKPYIILDEYLPEDKGAFGEKLARAKLTLMEKLEKLDLKPTAGGTSIIECLNLVSFMLSEEQGTKKLIILSDMRNTSGFDLENPSFIDEQILREVEEADLIPRLDGVEVWVLGASPCGKTLRYYKSLRSFWEKFFEKSGAHLISFSMEREWKVNYKGEKNDRKRSP
jgi:hypothetical protein